MTEALVRARTGDLSVAIPTLKVALLATELALGNLPEARALADALCDEPALHTAAFADDALARISLAEGDTAGAREHARAGQDRTAHRQPATTGARGLALGAAALQTGDTDEARHRLHDRSPGKTPTICAVTCPTASKRSARWRSKSATVEQPRLCSVHLPVRAARSDAFRSHPPMAGSEIVPARRRTARREGMVGALSACGATAARRRGRLRATRPRQARPDTHRLGKRDTHRTPGYRVCGRRIDQHTNRCTPVDVALHR